MAEKQNYALSNRQSIIILAKSIKLNGIAKKIIRLHNNGIKIVLSDLTYIINELNKEKLT